MNKYNSLFGQMLDLVGRPRFDSLVRSHKSDKFCNGLMEKQGHEEETGLCKITPVLQKWLGENPYSSVRKVVFNVFGNKDLESYGKVLNQFL